MKEEGGNVGDGAAWVIGGQGGNKRRERLRRGEGEKERLN